MDGILNIYKQKGYTSHDVVAKLRGILKQKKIGHTGTLDPDAEGVLPICLGKATKLSEFLTEKEKEYKTVLLLGVQTDTQDVTGNIINRADAPENILKLPEEKIKETIFSFVGEQEQVPPMYSALKVNGKKLYELARQGLVIERKPRKIQIQTIEIHSINLPRVEFSVTCSKGTYIRTLCNDIGEKLECYGCMEDLTRTRSGNFSMEDSLTLEEVETLKNNGKLEQHIVSIEEILKVYPKAVVDAGCLKLIENGNTLTRECFTRLPNSETDTVRVFDESGKFYALYEFDQVAKHYRCLKMF